MASLIENKRAHFDYEILESFEAGIELHGFEVKSLRARHGSFEGGRVVVRGGEAYVLNMSIPAYQPKNAPADYEPERPRRLLLSKKEILALGAYESQKGLTVVPLSVYNKGRSIKMAVGIGRGKKKFDKRDVIKKRETERDIARTLKGE